jgi:uncharacterized membrane protein HdeD (DUF308 family)
VRLSQTPIRNWWLLALCGVLDAILSVVYFSHAQHGFSLNGTVVFVGRLTLAAGACTIAAGIWSFREGKSRPLVLNGLACSVLGLTLAFWRGSLAFRTIALLIVGLAISIGIYELSTALALPRHLADTWLPGAAGLASLGFVLAFLAMGFRWVPLEPGPAQTVNWLGAYFGFSAICMLGLALRLRVGVARP